MMLVLTSAWTFFNSAVLTSPLLLEPVKVEIIDEDGQFTLHCNGEPFYVKGAGLEYSKMQSLAEHGGNALRTWSVDNGQWTGEEILDEAHKLGLLVSMGINVGKERHGFDYNDEKAVKEQFERIQTEVIRLKDHPALLVWGIGNELNLSYQNTKVWDAVNDIVVMIHELDPNHPTTTMLSAGALKEDINTVMKHCPDIDFLSFQIYGSIENLITYINESNYNGAYLVTEWGATGHWEVDNTSWGRPIEETSHEKAKAYKQRYEKVILFDTARCLGSFVFYWGQKQERTPTWYGLFLENGEETEVVDVMHFLWNNSWPKNRSPKLLSFSLEGQKADASITLLVGQECSAHAIVSEPDGDSLNYRWCIRTEVSNENKSEGGDFEVNTDIIMEYSNGEFDEELVFITPEPGEYRLFVYASDGQGHVGTANIPFLVIDN